MALADPDDAASAKFAGILGAADGTFTREQEAAIRHDYFVRQEGKIRELARTATDPRDAAALDAFAESWAALPLEHGGRTQPGREPIEAICPGLAGRIDKAATAQSNSAAGTGGRNRRSILDRLVRP